VGAIKRGEALMASRDQAVSGQPRTADSRINRISACVLIAHLIASWMYSLVVINAWHTPYVTKVMGLLFAALNFHVYILVHGLAPSLWINNHNRILLEFVLPLLGGFVNFLLLRFVLRFLARRRRDRTASS
jgi:hypothetical protein